MVNTEDFALRIQKLMDYYQLTATSFATSLGIGRSSISHIVSGRNKPSLEFVLKIIETYGEVDIFWLLNGKGNFPKQQSIPTPALQENDPKNLISKARTLDGNSVPQKQDDLFSLIDPKRTSKKPESTSPNELCNKNIERIVLFYNDGSFKEYHND